MDMEFQSDSTAQDAYGLEHWNRGFEYPHPPTGGIPLCW